jgi:SAM-dependent methyltransferase
MTSEKRQEDDWDSHWDRYAEAARQNPAQLMRHELLLDALRLVPNKGHRLLDVGSGQGDFLAKASRAGVAQAYMGFELSASGVEISRKKIPEAKFVQIDLYSPPPESKEFLKWATAAVCSDVIEHVDDPVGFLVALRGYLAEGATLVITVPGGPMSAFDQYIGHRRHYSNSLIRKTLDQAGFATERVWLAGFPFFNLYRLLVILRGRRLISDVAAQESGAAASRLAEFFMSAFRLLFSLNLRNSPLGWQVVAIAKNRG